MSIVSFPLFLTIAILSFFGSEESNPPLPVFEDGPSQKRVVQSEVANPRELSVRHYDLLTRERIHTRNFETIMNNGMAEAASYYE